MSIKKYLILSFVALSPLFVKAQQSRATIDSMHYAVREFRQSVRQDIRDYRDSIRDVRGQMCKANPHEFRIGWGDQLFETLVWYNQPHSTLYPESYVGQYEERYRYTQHWFAEYQYRVRYWFNVGAMVDYSGVVWDKVQRNGSPRGPATAPRRQAVQVPHPHKQHVRDSKSRH